MWQGFAISCYHDALLKRLFYNDASYWIISILLYVPFNISGEVMFSEKKNISGDSEISPMHEILCFMAYKKTLSHFIFPRQKVSTWRNQSLYSLSKSMERPGVPSLLIKHALRMMLSKLLPQTRNSPNILMEKASGREFMCLEGSWMLS